MKKCIIVGSVKTDAFTEKEKAPDTLYIAADGGYKYLTERGMDPDITVGDFDSLGEEPTDAFRGEVIKFPVEKDDTDTLIAVKEAMRRGCTEITLYGCLGGDRFDHSIATLQTLTYAAERGANVTAVGENGRYSVTAIKDGRMVFPCDREGTFSVFAASGECLGVSIENAKYTVKDATVTPSYPIGVSNSFIKGRGATVSVKKGTLWVITF